LEPRGLYSKRTQFWRRSSNSACARPGGEDTSAKRMRTSVGAIHDALPIFPLARLLLSAWLHQRSSHPCVHGTCQDALGIPEYHCQCDGGFSGDNCETNDDDCASFPCMHGGSCLDGADTFMCVCAVGHTGGKSSCCVVLCCVVLCCVAHQLLVTLYACSQKCAKSAQRWTRCGGTCAGRTRLILGSMCY
jgi:hypothetical protein